MSSVIFRQVGSKRQSSRRKMVTDNRLQLYFVKLSEDGSGKNMLIQAE